MSIAAYGVVWRHSETTGGHRLVMLALADHADDDGLCWPSVATIADLVRLSTRHIQRILGDLVRRGELLVAGRGPRGTTRYRIRMRAATAAQAPDIGDTLAGSVSADGGDVDVTPPLTQASPKPSEIRQIKGDSSSSLSGQAAYAPEDDDPPSRSRMPADVTAILAAAHDGLTAGGICLPRRATRPDRDAARAWIAAGAAPALVRLVARLVAVRVIKGGYAQPRSLAYLDRAVSEALDGSTVCQGRDGGDDANLYAALIDAAVDGLTATGAAPAAPPAPADVARARVWGARGATPDLVRRAAVRVGAVVAARRLPPPQSLAYLDRAVSEALAEPHADPTAEDVQDAHRRAAPMPRSSFRARNREAIARAVARRLGADISIGDVLGGLPPFPGQPSACAS
ncbi:helix-turn-helix domain-containing protein [Roseospira visakhapatnamensis]|uniref:Helix-turn-helix protein n=1 Tax=Roseospira visakhapatnamensis TaxID=390880 RepID=A0A7W6RGM8_9PROT|nr:helix-turn-helix domain-containing protein [Roseospira visakhapatnamensis]MBB4268193.1 hypothetical protein [Roseospira visakhapatnamensis]